MSLRPLILLEFNELSPPLMDKFIKAGGKPVACGWLTDHFGVSWQIDPKLLIDMITDPDPAKASMAMQSMITMVKIDSEKLKQAVGA